MCHQPLDQGHYMNSDGKSFPITRRQFVTVSAAGLAASAFAHQAHARVGAPEQPAGGPFRVIIDTDPGVDDALALLLAMRSPELKIEAITPVAGNVPLELTLPNALRMVEIAGRTDIPVASGAKAPACVGGLCAWRKRVGRSSFSGAEGQTRRRACCGIHSPYRSQISHYLPGVVAHHANNEMRGALVQRLGMRRPFHKRRNDIRIVIRFAERDRGVCWPIREIAPTPFIAEHRKTAQIQRTT